MGEQQNRFWRCLRFGFVALAFVFYPYFVNQMPALGTLLKNVPNWAVFLGAFAFAAIVVVRPELLPESKTDPEELFQKLAKKNLEMIKDRLKSSLDQYSYIPIHSIDSPQIWGVPQPLPRLPSQPSQNPSLSINRNHRYLIHLLPRDGNCRICKPKQSPS